MADFELGSDEWFADHLLSGLAADYERLLKCYRYREGTNQLPAWGTGQSLSMYSQIIDLSRLNFAWQIVSAHVSRKELKSVRSALATHEGDSVADELAFASALDLQFSDAMLSKGTYGRGYLTVSADETVEGPENVYLTASDAWQTFALRDAKRPWLVRAAVTVGWDAVASEDTVTLHRSADGDSAGYSVQWRAFRESGESTFPSPEDGVTSFSVVLDDGSWVKQPSVPYPEGQRCQVFEFSTETGKGEFERHYATLDRINHTILQRVVITVMQAFKQRAVAGDFPTEYPENHPRAGETIDYDELFKAGPDALWFIPEGAKMWESAAVDIRPILDAVRDDLKMLASAASIPIYVLAPEAAGGSAEGARSASETQTRKTRRDERRDKRVLASVLSAEFRLLGDEARAVESKIEVEFEDSTLVSPFDRANVFKTLRDGGASRQFALQRAYGLTSAQIQQEAAFAAREALQRGVMSGSGNS